MKSEIKITEPAEFVSGSPVTWLLAGCGDIARKRVAPALSEAEDSRLIAVCDPVREKAEALARENGVEEVYTDFTEALKKSRSKAVYLAVPVHFHVPMAIKAIEACRHVLVEKPLGLSFPDTQAAVQAEAAAPVTSGCAYFRRFYPAYRMVREMLDRGEFGRIVHIRMAYFSWFDPSPDDPKYWRILKAKSGGGPIADMGAHMFDVLIGLFGIPESVSAITSTHDRSWDVEEDTAILMRMGDGALVEASFSWNSKTWSHTFEIIGTEARVLWQPYDSGKVLKTVGRETVELNFPCAPNVHLPLIEDFTAAARNGRKPLVTLAEAAKTNRLIDAVYLSALERREVEV
jgi:predicted dehydrogenase